jgi:hypothetical protein
MRFFFAKFEPQNQKISCVYFHSSPNVDKIPVLAVCQECPWGNRSPLSLERDAR